jgi:multidrug efflux system membrane fusion protein
MKWILIGLIFLSGCSNGRSEKPAVVSVPVAVSTAIEKDVPTQLRAIGNVQALSTVYVKSRIGGELIRVNFMEGQDVKKGDLLFTIDPRPLEAALKQAEANLARDLAHVKRLKPI